MPDTRNLFNKVWDLHTVATLPSGQTQLFIGLHLIHEVTSPQAFQMLREMGRKVRFPGRTFATVDHIIPTDSQVRPLSDSLAEDMLQQHVLGRYGRVRLQLEGPVAVLALRREQRRRAAVHRTIQGHAFGSAGDGRARRQGEILIVQQGFRSRPRTEYSGRRNGKPFDAALSRPSR